MIEVKKAYDLIGCSRQVVQRTVYRILGNVSHLTDEDIDKVKARLVIEKVSMSKSQLSKKLKVNSSLVNEIMKSKNIPTVKGAAGYDLITPNGIKVIEKYVKEKNSDRKNKRALIMTR